LRRKIKDNPLSAPRPREADLVIRDLNRQLAAAKTRIKNLEAERAAAPSSEEARLEIESLKRRLSVERERRRVVDARNQAAGLMPEDAVRVFDRLHPDRRGQRTAEQKEADVAEAYARFNGWWRGGNRQGRGRRSS
jgi:hypothetical protein